ncbi:MAG: D-alanyl-D-alanine carboxypeptidase [Candidatus Polarisedimenticolia bacterium]
MKPPCGILPRVRGRAVPLAAVAALLAFAAVPALAAGRAPKSAARTPRRSVAPKAAEPAPSAFSGLVWHVETEAGAEVDGRLSDEPINPASVTKAATTLWALERLGPDHRFETRILAAHGATVRAGELQGDLVVEGTGDPDFRPENAMLVALKLNELGIKRIHGALVVNRRFWIGWENGSQGRDPDPAKRALTMNARLRQALDPGRWNGLMRRSWVELAAARGLDAQRPPKVVVAGGSRESARVGGRLLAVHRSRTLRATLHELNCYSNNDIERIGESLGDGPELTSFLQERWRLPAGTIQFQTASGLGENRISPRLVVGLMRDLEQTCRRMGMELEDVLPAVGCDPGTVAHFFGMIAAAPETAAVVGKTGTLTATDGGVSVFAGVIRAKEGNFYFCVGEPRAAGRLRRARWKEEQFVLDLLAKHGGAVGRACRAPGAAAGVGAEILGASELASLPDGVHEAGDETPAFAPAP